MCLDRITERIPTPTPLVRDGWKFFTGDDAQPKFQVMKLKGSDAVPLDRWLTAEGLKITAGDGGLYSASFHVWEKFEQLRDKRTPRRVYVRFVHTVGKQGDNDVLIAKEMYVPSNPNDWPPTSEPQPPPQPAGKDKNLLQSLRKRVSGKTGNA